MGNVVPYLSIYLYIYLYIYKIVANFDLIPRTTARAFDLQSWNWDINWAILGRWYINFFKVLDQLVWAQITINCSDKASFWRHKFEFTQPLIEGRPAALPPFFSRAGHLGRQLVLRFQWRKTYAILNKIAISLEPLVRFGWNFDCKDIFDLQGYLKGNIKALKPTVFDLEVAQKT